jgi:hypothetical protein
LQFIAVRSDNHVDVQTRSVGWDDPDATTGLYNNLYTEVGERVDSSASDVDPAGTYLPADRPAVKGVVMDVEYRNSTTNAVIRPKRYMTMLVNFQRVPNPNNGTVAIVLNYKWAVPDQHTSAGGPVYLSSQVRTVKSATPSY